MMADKRHSLDVFQSLCGIYDELSFIYDGISMYTWRMHHMQHGTVRMDNDEFTNIVNDLSKHGFIIMRSQGYMPTDLGRSRMQAYF